MTIDRREFLQATALTAASAAFPMTGRRDTNKRPNILHLQVDQMQWAAIAGRSVCSTPHINRLAAEGMLFDRSYTACAVCCPSRALLCSGAYPWHNGVFNQVHSAPSVHRDMFPVVETYSQRLQEAGYRQGYVGKWHASFLRTPLSFGYDEIAAPLAYNPRLLVGLHINPDHVPRPAPQPVTTSEQLQWPGSEPFTMWGTTGGDPNQSESYWVAENGIRMLDRFASGDKPWHIEIQWLAPHDPYLPHQSFLARYPSLSITIPASFSDTFAGKPEMHKRESESWGQITEDMCRRGRAHYFAYCEEVDAQVGRVLEALKSTGQEADTMVVFTADHGDMAGAHCMWSKGWMPYEEGYRVPLVMRWPGRIPPGIRSRRLVQVHDLAYTYVEAANAQPLSRAEGHSLLRLAGNPNDPSWPEHRLCAYYGAEFLYTQRIVLTERWKYIFNGFAFDEMYDLEKDPNELHNLAADPDYKDRVADMQARLYELMGQLGDPFGDPSPRFAMPDSEPPNRYGAPRYISRGRRMPQSS